MAPYHSLAMAESNSHPMSFFGVCDHFDDERLLAGRGVPEVAHGVTGVCLVRIIEGVCVKKKCSYHITSFKI
jgi:hypothetical protein